MRHNLIIARKDKDFTQREMAVQFDVTEQHYQRIEAGTSRGSMKFWEAAREYFGKPIDWLMENK